MIDKKLIVFNKHLVPNNQDFFNNVLNQNNEINNRNSQNRINRIDFSFIKELPVIQEYYNNFHNNIDWLIARPANFTHQKQSNQNWWVDLKTNPGKALDKVMGIQYKVVPRDKKGYKGMICYNS